MLEERYLELKDLYPDAYKPWDWEEITFETGKITLLSNPIQPKNKEPWMWYSLNQLMAQGSEVIFYTPYIICGKEMYDDLQTLTEKGTRIDIITNDVNRGANPWGCTDYLNQKEKIWSTGVKVYEYMGAHSSRTKAVLIDDRMSIIGSYNLDMRSTYQDTELMLAVDSPTLNQMIQKEAEYDKTCSRIADENGNYTYGENYVPREMSTGKKIIYGILRVVTVPIRKFL